MTRTFVVVTAAGESVVVEAHVRAAAMTRGVPVALVGLTHVRLAGQGTAGDVAGGLIPASARFTCLATATAGECAGADTPDAVLLDALQHAWTAPAPTVTGFGDGCKRTLGVRTPVLCQLPVLDCPRCTRAPGTGCYCVHCGLRVRLVSETPSAADAWLFGAPSASDSRCPTCGTGVASAAQWCGACGVRQTAWEEPAAALRGQGVTVTLHWDGRAMGRLSGTVAACWLDQEAAVPRVICTFDTPILDGVIIPGTGIAVALDAAGDDLLAPVFALGRGAVVAATPVRAEQCACGAATAERWCAACGARVALFADVELLGGAPVLRSGACCAAVGATVRFCGLCGTRRAVMARPVTVGLGLAWVDDFASATL